MSERGEAYVCDYCGHQGRDPRPVDRVQRPMCGEPVLPLDG